MDGLRALARHLVVLAVLAGLVEIALPRSSLRPPARLVLGLVLLLAVLAPALDLLHQPVHWQEALASVSASPVGDYREQAAELSRATAGLARQELERRLVLTAEVAARQVPGVAGARARVDLGEAAAGQPPPVERVELWLRPAGERIDPVQPVQVGRQPAVAAPDPADAVLVAAVCRAVAGSLGVPPGRVTATLTAAGVP